MKLSIEANEQYNKSMEDLWEVVCDPDRVSVLLSLAEDKVQILEEKRELFSESDKVGCKYIYLLRIIQKSKILSQKRLLCGRRIMTLMMRMKQMKK